MQPLKETSGWLERLTQLGSVPFGRVIQLVLGATAVVILLHFLFVLVATLVRGRAERPARWRWLERCLYSLLLLSIAALAGTAFYGMIGLGRLAGAILLVHMGSANVFLFSLAALALLWARPCRYEGRTPAGEKKFRPVSKLLFFLLLAAGFCVGLSMLLAMLPLFDTAGMLRLFALHRYAGLATTVLAVLHLYTTWTARLGLS